MLIHKISVAVLMILDTTHGACMLHAVYSYIVTGWGDSAGLHEIIWSVQIQVSLNVAIILLVQSLYTFRVWLLSGYYKGLLGYLSIVAVAGGFGIGIALAYKIFTVGTFEELKQVSWVINAALASSTVIDFTIAIAMCYYLWKSKTATSRLNSRLSNLIQFTLGSGVLTSACSTSALLSHVFMPDNFIFLGVQFLLTKLYLVSFLTMLNSRPRGGSGATTDDTPTMTVDLPLQSYHATRGQMNFPTVITVASYTTKDEEHGQAPTNWSSPPQSPSSRYSLTKDGAPVYATAW